MVKGIKSVFMKMYGLIASVAVILVLVLSSIPHFNSKTESQVKFLTKSGDHIFNVEIADSGLKRAKGLMNRTHMPEDSGMLFIFEDEREVSFWMKNTLIPLDMIFISGDNKIVNIHNAQPCKTLDCESYKSEGPVKYVVEINGGLSGKLGIKIGDKIEIED